MSSIRLPRRRVSVDGAGRRRALAVVLLPDRHGLLRARLSEARHAARGEQSHRNEQREQGVPRRRSVVAAVSRGSRRATAEGGRVGPVALPLAEGRGGRGAAEGLVVDYPAARSRRASERGGAAATSAARLAPGGFRRVRGAHRGRPGARVGELRGEPRGVHGAQERRQGQHGGGRATHVGRYTRQVARETVKRDGLPRASLRVFCHAFRDTERGTLSKRKGEYVFTCIKLPWVPTAIG